MPDGGDSELLDMYENDFPKFVDMFRPDIVLASAGYDLHESDSLTQLKCHCRGDIRDIVY